MGRTALNVFGRFWSTGRTSDGGKRTTLNVFGLSVNAWGDDLERLRTVRSTGGLVLNIWWMATLNVSRYSVWSVDVCHVGEVSVLNSLRLTHIIVFEISPSLQKFDAPWQDGPVSFNIQESPKTFTPSNYSIRNFTLSFVGELQHLLRLQHSEGVDSPPHSPLPRCISDYNIEKELTLNSKMIASDSNIQKESPPHLILCLHGHFRLHSHLRRGMQT